MVWDQIKPKDSTVAWSTSINMPQSSYYKFKEMVLWILWQVHIIPIDGNKFLSRLRSENPVPWIHSNQFHTGVISTSLSSLQFLLQHVWGKNKSINESFNNHQFPADFKSRLAKSSPFTNPQPSTLFPYSFSWFFFPSFYFIIF